MALHSQACKLRSEQGAECDCGAWDEECPECERCGETYQVRDGCDTGKYCDTCAQTLVLELERDKERLDWLEALMTPADDFCEVFLAGLRTSISQPATAFQIESNPEKFPTTSGATLRDAIDAVLQPNHD